MRPNNPTKPIAGAAIAAMLVAMGLPLAATSASAAVDPGHIINVFPNRDFVMAEGYAPGSAHTVNVVRAGFTVGTSPAVANAAGFVEVNHPAIFPNVKNCWVGVTPDLRPGDVIQVDAETTVTTGINLTQRATFDGFSTVTLKGTAPGATAGTRIPIEQLEVRANAKNTKFIHGGNASVRADSTGTMEGIVRYDLPLPSTAWTATFLDMGRVNPAEADGFTDGVRAVNSESVAMSITNLQELTNSEMGPNPATFVKGPAFPDCTAPAASGPTTPVMTPATNTGISTTDGLTNNPLPTFGGVPALPTATRVDLFVDGVLNGSTAVANGAPYSITPTTPLLAGTRVITVGEFGPINGANILTMGNSPASVTIDLTRPRTTGVRLTTPGASQLANVEAFFDEQVSGFGGTPLIALTTAAGVPVAARLTYTPATRSAVLDPTASLAPSTRYFATLKGGVMGATNLTSGLGDVAGNPLANFSFSFVTGPKPIVTSKRPAANAVRVGLSANVTAKISENVRGISWRTFTVKKTSTGQGVTRVIVSYNSLTHVATLNPKANLARNTRYTATLSSLIIDVDGNRMSTTSWRFTTRR